MFLEHAQGSLGCSHCCRLTFQVIMGWKQKELRNATGLTCLFITHDYKILKLNDYFSIGVARIFHWGDGAKHKSHAMTLSKVFKRGTFMGQRYRRMKDQKPWLIWY